MINTNIDNSDNSKTIRNKPNFLFIMTDEQRFPAPYENNEIKEWRSKYLKAQNKLRENGFEFLNHYTATTACAPARASLFTGQYPSLHGVSQTDGAAKGAFDPDMFWLDPNTVPTMGDYFREGGYRTYYKGKWHISASDIIIPGTKNAVASYDPNTGVPDPEKTKLYLKSERLDDFGYNLWLGPEPHGQAPHNSGASANIGVSGRDVVYRDEVVNLINKLDESDDPRPWFMVASFVNPHDIALYGELTKNLPIYNFDIDPSVPNIPPAPTANDDLSTKPECQESYKIKYQLGFQPTTDSETYRKLYYSLQLTVDNNVQHVLSALKKSKFFDNTVVVYTSDHGDYLGAHGLFQKWYTAYEEAIHVPLIIKLPKNINSSEKNIKNTSELTSAVDILPTLLNIAHLDVDSIQKKLRKDHDDVRKLVGKDLTQIILSDQNDSNDNCNDYDSTILFTADDDVLRGSNQVTLTGAPYTVVIQPNHIQTIVTKLNDNDIYKYSRYYDNPMFWSTPNVQDNVLLKEETITKDNITADITFTKIKTTPIPDQIEMYNLSTDPYEQFNLANPKYSTPDIKIIQDNLAKILDNQVKLKLLNPSNSTSLNDVALLDYLKLLPKPS